MDKTKEEDAVIEFSARLAETFREKVKRHNGSYPNKVSLGQVVKVFRHGAESFVSEAVVDLNINEWSMARVNMFLRMKQGKVSRNKIQTEAPKEVSMSALIFETPSIKRVDSFLDLTKNWTPNDEDFELAKTDAKNNQLNYNFKTVEEIYLTDESPSSRSIEIIY
jgi:hypothetical protein